jgi:hypothetical protein
MDYYQFTPAEAERELERYQFALDKAREFAAQPEEQRELESKIQQLRERLKSDAK